MLCILLHSKECGWRGLSSSPVWERCSWHPGRQGVCGVQGATSPVPWWGVGRAAGVEWAVLGPASLPWDPFNLGPC